MSVDAVKDGAAVAMVAQRSKRSDRSDSVAGVVTAGPGGTVHLEQVIDGFVIR